MDPARLLPLHHRPDPEPRRAHYPRARRRWSRRPNPTAAVWCCSPSRRHARRGVVAGDDDPDGRQRPGAHEDAPPRPRRRLAHHGAREGGQRGDRRRRHGPPAGRRAREARPELRPVVVVRDRVRRRDLLPRRQGEVPRAPARRGDRRLLRCVRDRVPGIGDGHRRRGAPHLPPRRRHRRARRARRRGAAGFRRGGPPGPGRLRAHRLLQGRGEDEVDLRGARRPPVGDPGRHGGGRGRRHDHPARPGLREHQLRGREDLPGGGRERAQVAPRRLRRGGRGRARRALG